VELCGDFEEGDIIKVLDEDGRTIAFGKSSYNSTEALSLLGRHDVKPLIHYDYLCLA